MISMKVDESTFVSVHDGHAADGAVHIVNCLLIPPLIQGVNAIY